MYGRVSVPSLFLSFVVCERNLCGVPCVAIWVFGEGIVNVRHNKVISVV